MKRVVIIGAGGHAREVAEILRHQARQGDDLQVLGFVVDDPENHGATAGQSPVLGDWSWFEDVDRGELAVICAIGSPQVRKRLVERAVAKGLSFVNAISPLAYLSPQAKVGEGVMMFPHTFASADSLIDDHAIINVGATVSHNSRVGRFCTVSPGVHLAGDVSIGEGSYLGIGSSVINRVSVGEWTTVGGGAVVTMDLPDNVTAVGLPARVVKSIVKRVT